jgi:putative FmdB family regulatory protein
MPTYDYVCTSCGEKIEVIHSVHGHGPSACPRCGSAMKKAFSAPAVVYKGTGWARKEGSGGRKSAKSSSSEGSSEPATPPSPPAAD